MPTAPWPSRFKQNSRLFGWKVRPQLKERSVRKSCHSTATPILSTSPYKGRHPPFTSRQACCSLRNQGSSRLITNVGAPNARLVSFPPKHHDPTFPASRQRRRRFAQSREELHPAFQRCAPRRKAG